VTCKQNKEKNVEATKEETWLAFQL
jgi:hypothetical protein